MNYQHTNWLFDVVMPQVDANAFRIICVVARKTWGWGKNADAISISQFMKYAGIKNKTNASRAIKKAIESGFISRHEGKRQFVYRMNFTENVVPNQYQSGGTETVPYSHISGTETVPSGTESVPTSVPNQYPQSKKESKNNNNGDFVRAVSAYENNIGAITKFASDAIAEAVEDYGVQWVTEAIDIAAENNVRKWVYVNGILKRRREEGQQPKRNETTVTADGGFYV